ncbi:MAG: single-stranded DNA-binding protein [Planctomycetota bacterium]|nr:MAG: single-stranded DNA-binding protein [Planctomycetota bacterium]
MANLNKVMLIGNLTRDPQLSYLPSQMAVVEFGMAVNDRRKQQDGSYADKANFIDLSIFGKRAEALQKYVKKGDPLFVEGKLDYQQWEKDGQKRSKLKVIVQNFEFLSKGSSGSQSGGNQGGGYQQSAPAPSAPVPPAPEAPPVGGMDDDIPF